MSASLDVYLVSVAGALGVDATALHQHSSATRRELHRAAPRRELPRAEKATRLQALFGDDDVELWAYGNSGGDDEMLALAHHPVRVRRGRVGHAGTGLRVEAPG